MLTIFGAGGLARQIIDGVPPASRFVTDTGGGDICGLPIERFDLGMGGELIIAVRDLPTRHRIAAQWAGDLGRYIDATAQVSRYAQIADGAIMCRNAVIEAEASLGRHSQANIGAKIGHGSKIGDFSVVGPDALVCGDCTIGRDVYIGAGAIIREGTTVGDGAFIGMGSMIFRDVPPDARMVFGRARPQLAA